MTRPAVLMALKAGLLHLSASANACSVARSYRVPSNYQLVEQADAIVIGRIESGSLFETTDTRASATHVHNVRLRILSKIKNADLPAFVDFDGAMIAPARTHVAESEPTDLLHANRDAFSGGCNRYIFKEGMILVAFLKKVEGRWYQNMMPFARTLEDVPSLDAPRVKTVRLYAKIAAMPKALRAAEMKRRREQLAVNADDPDARLMLADLDRAMQNGL